LFGHLQAVAIYYSQLPVLFLPARMVERALPKDRRWAPGGPNRAAPPVAVSQCVPLRAFTPAPGS